MAASSQWAICRSTPWASCGVRGRDQNISKTFMSGYLSMFRGPGGGVCLISFWPFFINDDGGRGGLLVCG